MEVANPIAAHLQSRIRSHLSGKTRALRRLRELTRAFAASFALEALPEFERGRARLLKVVSLHDGRLAEAASALPLADRADPEFLAVARRESAAQEAEVLAILADDETVLASIRAAQGELAREIARNSKQGQDLARFRSEWVGRSGEGIDSHV